MLAGALGDLHVVKHGGAHIALAVQSQHGGGAGVISGIHGRSVVAAVVDADLLDVAAEGVALADHVEEGGGVVAVVGAASGHSHIVGLQQGGHTSASDLNSGQALVEGGSAVGIHSAVGGQVQLDLAAGGDGVGEHLALHVALSDLGLGIGSLSSAGIGIAIAIGIGNHIDVAVGVQVVGLGAAVLEGDLDLVVADLVTGSGAPDVGVLVSSLVNLAVGDQVAVLIEIEGGLAGEDGLVDLVHSGGQLGAGVGVNAGNGVVLAADGEVGVAVAGHGTGGVLDLGLLVGLDGAGHGLSQLDMQLAADESGQDEVVLLHVLEAHDIVLVVGDVVALGAAVAGHTHHELAVVSVVLQGDLAQTHLLVEHVVDIAVAVGVHDGLHNAGPAVLSGSGGAHGAVVVGILGVSIDVQVVVVSHVSGLVAGGVGDDVVALVHEDAADDGGLQRIVGVVGGLDIHPHSLAQDVLTSGGGEGHGAGEDALLVVVADHDAGAVGVQSGTNVHALRSAVGILLVAIQVGELVGDGNALHLHSAEHLPQKGALLGVVQLGLGGDSVVSSAGDHVAVGDHAHVQSVVQQLSGVVTGQVGAGDGVGQILIEAQSVGPDIGVDLPVGTSVALNTSVVAQSDQDHLAGLSNGHVAVGVEGAVALTSHDAKSGAVLDVALGPVIGGVGVGVVEGLTQHRILATVQDDTDHLGHLGPGDDPGGVIGAVVLAVDDIQSGKHRDGLFVDDVSAIAEIINAHSANADNHHGNDHDESQSQAESPLEVSHLEFLLLKFGVLD